MFVVLQMVNVTQIVAVIGLLCGVVILYIDIVL